MEKEEDRSLHLRLPPDLFALIKASAGDQKVPVNWWIIKILDRQFGKSGRWPRSRQIR